MIKSYPIASNGTPKSGIFKQIIGKGSTFELSNGGKNN